MTVSRPVITVIGSLNIDLVSYIPRHPSPAETVYGRHYEESCGGKGANQAVACAKLSRSSSLLGSSADIFMVGDVGADRRGQVLIESLELYGVSTTYIGVDQSPGTASITGTATILVDETDGQNRIISLPGANGSIQPERFTQIHGPRPDLLILQLEIPLQTVLQAIKTAHETGIAVLLNPAPAISLPDNVYPHLTHLILNETETAFYARVSEADLEFPSTIVQAASHFLDKGVSNVVITLGARGVYYATNTSRSSFVPAPKVEVVDTTAAGDTFIGSYALDVVNAALKHVDFDIDAAVHRAIRASAKTISRKGAQVSIPWRDEIEGP